MSLATFNLQSRPELFQQLTREPWDLLIIGGGITGASVFRDATLRRMKVALVEARDFASGTSSRSSKLIHGGLRYLKNLGLGLAWESCHERNLHIRLNQRLVRPLPFLVPLFKDRGESRLQVRAGMLLYELLSSFGNSHCHRFLTREQTLSAAPGLPVEGLTGACLYYDAVTSDSRWTMEIIKDGVRHGGLALNYTPVTGLLKNEGLITAVQLTDSLTGQPFEVKARAVVNATGVFADRVRKMVIATAKPLLHLSKGTHLVFNEADVPLNITIVFHSPLDDRPLFLVKREGGFLYGTTDDWEEADPDTPVPGSREVNYLLKSLQQFMPEAALTADKVQFVYSGFRPLLAGNGAADSVSASREDCLEVSPSGLISVVGGKMTTARLMAIRILDQVSQKLGPSSRWLACQTGQLAIGGTNEEVAEGLAFRVKQCPRLASYFRILFQRYGTDAHEICAEATRIFQGRHPDPHAEPIRAEVQYVCRHEMVCTVEDLLDRRAGYLFWNAAKRLERLRHGTNAIRMALGLSLTRFEEQYRAYEAHLQQFHTLPELETISEKLNS